MDQKTFDTRQTTANIDDHKNNSKLNERNVVFGRGFENRNSSKEDELKTPDPELNNEKNYFFRTHSINPATAASGIVLSEILGPPKALRNKKRGSVR